MRVPVLVRVSECVYAPVRVRAGTGEQLSVSESEGEREKGSKGEGERDFYMAAVPHQVATEGGGGKENERESCLKFQSRA